MGRIRIRSNPELFAGAGSAIRVSDPDPERIPNKFFDPKLNFSLKNDVNFFVENGNNCQEVNI